MTPLGTRPRSPKNFRDDATSCRMATNNGLDCRRVQPNFCPCIPTLIPIVPLKKSDSQGCYPSTIEVISPSEYPAGSTSVSVRLKVSDAKGLHQVLLSDVERESAGAAGGMPWMWTARKTQSSNSRGAVRNISYLTQPALCAARTRSISTSRSCAAENSGWSLRSCSKTAAALLTYPNSRWSTPKL